MPYKDAEAARKAKREWARKNRVEPDVEPAEIEPEKVEPVDGWPDVRAYISREVPNMPNLERLQRIAGSLGKLSGEVWFGISGMTMEDIGSVIGTMEGKYSL